jgi:hypothetical protein
LTGRESLNGGTIHAGDSRNIFRELCIIFEEEMGTDTQVRKAAFAYQQHADGNISAICLQCYAVAATARTLSNLASLESAHCCRKESVKKAATDGCFVLQSSSTSH